MIKHQNAGDNGLCYYTFASFDQSNMVRHAFTTKLGGVSQGAHGLGTMNMCLKEVEDKAVTVENLRIISAALGINPKNTVTSDQTHTVTIRKVTANDRGKGYFWPQDYARVDALMTNEPLVCLVTYHADCTPVFLLDPVKKAVALVHAGWRGMAGKLPLLTLKALCNEYQSDPKDVLVGIGPSICGDCFEVDEDVAHQFDAWQDNIKAIVNADGQKKYTVDLWAVCQSMLTNAGVLNNNIELSGLCTKEQPDVFYSHRVMGTMRGNMAAMIELD